MEAKLEGESR